MFWNHNNFKNGENYKLKTSKGFTLLYATLISSLLLAIGLAIFNITIKELILSSSARESQFAFYAADSGIECALYWDIKRGPISTTTPTPISCNGTDMTVGGVGYGVPSVFSFDFLPDESYCVDVTVIKNETHPRTVLKSRGYNTCDTTNPRRIERAIEATY